MKYNIILVQDIISVISDRHGTLPLAVDHSEIKAHVEVMSAAIRQSEEKTKAVLKAVEDEYHKFILDNIAKYEQLVQDAIESNDSASANRSRVMAAVYHSMLDSFMQSRKYATL